MNEIHRDLPEEEVVSPQETAEKSESLVVENVYFAEVLSRKNYGGATLNDKKFSMILYSPQESIAIAKRFHHENEKEYSLEPTTLTLNNPLRLTHREYISGWHPGYQGTAMADNISRAIESGYDGLVVEADPEADQQSKKPEDYTYATETYYKFVNEISEDQ